MHGRTRSHKPELKLGLERLTQRKRLPRDHERREELGGRVDSCVKVGSTNSSLIEALEGEAGPFKLSSKILSETEVGEGKTHIESDSEERVDTPIVTMVQDGKRGVPPHVPPIDMLVRPRDFDRLLY